MNKWDDFMPLLLEGQPLCGLEERTRYRDPNDDQIETVIYVGSDGYEYR